MNIEDFVLDFKRTAAIFLQEYKGERVAADRDEWVARFKAWREARAASAVNKRRTAKAEAEAEETSRRLAALDVVLVTDERLQAAIEESGK